jgi:hypothetical protein
MPKRPKQHQLEDISFLEFQRVLPKEWVFRRKDKDYGIDGEVEIFDEQGMSTGLIFFVQLKATESKSKKTQHNISIKTETIKYYKSLPIQVLIVRYVEEVNKIYCKWAHEIDLYLAKKTFSIAMGDENIWENNVTPKAITHTILKIKEFRNRDNVCPVKTFVKYEAIYCHQKPRRPKRNLSSQMLDLKTIFLEKNIMSKKKKTYSADLCVASFRAKLKSS